MPAPLGVPQVEVTFAIDSNGIVSVSARDLATNKSQSVQITRFGALPKMLSTVLPTAWHCSG